MPGESLRTRQAALVASYFGQAEGRTRKKTALAAHTMVRQSVGFALSQARNAMFYLFETNGGTANKGVERCSC